MIITGRIPADRQRATASAASRRAGSISPASPQNVSSSSASDSKGWSGHERRASASTRSACPAMRAAAARICWRPASSSGASPSAVTTWVHCGSSISGAPLVNISRPPSGVRCTRDIALRVESKGSSWTTRPGGICWSNPAFRPATSNAPSVGSPMTRQAGFSSVGASSRA